MDEESHTNHRKKKCWFLDFWKNWGPHFDFAGGIACLSMLTTILWCGFGFIRDTQATNKKVYQQAASIALVTVKNERMDVNLQRIMLKMKIPPLPKTQTEVLLEKKAPMIVFDDSESTDDNSRE